MAIDASTKNKQKLKEEITIRPFNSNKDLAGISTLVKSMDKEPADILFLRNKEPEYYNWMYNKNPAGKACVYIAEHKNKIIANFAIAPKKIKIGNNIFTCGKVMDMFTQPDYQGLGIMSRLCSSVFKAAKKQGIKFWYVHPSKNSYPIFKNKWGYIENTELIYYTKIIRPFNFIWTSIRAKKTTSVTAAPDNIKMGKYTIKKVSRFSDETDRLWGKIKSDYNTALVRNAEYMNWRFIENPDPYISYFFYDKSELKAILVLKTTIRKGQRTGEITDIMINSSETKLFKVLIKFSRKVFKKMKCNFMQIWIAENSILDKMLNKTKFWIKRKRLKFVLSPDAPDNSFYNTDSWLISQGDGNDI